MMCLYLNLLSHLHSIIQQCKSMQVSNILISDTYYSLVCAVVEIAQKNMYYDGMIILDGKIQSSTSLNRCYQRVQSPLLGQPLTQYGRG
jgi:hypothetical protein